MEGVAIIWDRLTRGTDSKQALAMTDGDIFQSQKQDDSQQQCRRVSNFKNIMTRREYT